MLLKDGEIIMKEFHFKYRKQGIHAELEQYIYRLGTYHYNWHRDLELFLMLEGSAEVCAGGISRIFQEGDLILINANEGHTTLAKDSGAIAMVIHLDPVSLREYYDNVEYLSFHLCSREPGGKEQKAKEQAFGRIRRDMARMMLAAQGETPRQKLLFECSLYDLLYTIVSEFPPEKIRSAAFKANLKNMDSIHGMVKYINKNYYKRISLDSLAKESGYNSSYISQLFKTCVGINFYDYLTRIRLREATRALSQSDEKILDIALAHGFSDLKSFNTSFKETFRKSPTEYRKMLNLENRSNDPFFKKRFVDAGDPLVLEKLQRYGADESQERETAEKEGETSDRAGSMECPADRLERLAEELVKTACELRKSEKEKG